jgi:hypothetical protein
VRGNGLLPGTELLVEPIRQGQPVGQGPGLFRERLFEVDDFLPAHAGLLLRTRRELVRLLPGLESGFLPEIVGVACRMAKQAFGLFPGSVADLEGGPSPLSGGPQDRTTGDDARQEGAEGRQQSRRYPHKSSRHRVLSTPGVSSF